jgi:hypothetical protein
MENKQPLNRLCIYAKDIQKITGRSERFGRKLLSEIRECLNKHRRQFVTLHEFCEYTGIHIDHARKLIQC